MSTEARDSKQGPPHDHGRARTLLSKISVGLKQASDQGPADPLNGTTPSSISSDFTITGNITCKGQAQFDGEVNGNIECHHLIVGRNGRITGDIKAEDVVVYGRVEGAIRCVHITLKSGATVQGDVYHNGISIEMGASFLGRSDWLTAEAEADAAAPRATVLDTVPRPQPVAVPSRK